MLGHHQDRRGAFCFIFHKINLHDPRKDPLRQEVQYLYVWWLCLIVTFFLFSQGMCCTDVANIDISHESASSYIQNNYQNSSNRQNSQMSQWQYIQISDCNGYALFCTFSIVLHCCCYWWGFLFRTCGRTSRTATCRTAGTTDWWWARTIRRYSVCTLCHIVLCCTGVATAAKILDEALSSYIHTEEQQPEHQTEGILSTVMPYFAHILFLLHCTDVAIAALEIHHGASCITFIVTVFFTPHTVAFHHLYLYK